MSTDHDNQFFAGCSDNLPLDQGEDDHEAYTTMLERISDQDVLSEMMMNGVEPTDEQAKKTRHELALYYLGWDSYTPPTQ